MASSKRTAAGGVTQVQLASEYGISQSAVSYIVRGEHWRTAGDA